MRKKSRVKQGKSSVPVEELTREELLEMNQWLEMELEYTKKYQAHKEELARQDRLEAFVENHLPKSDVFKP